MVFFYQIFCLIKFGLVSFVEKGETVPCLPTPEDLLGVVEQVTGERRVPGDTGEQSRLIHPGPAGEQGIF